MPQNTVIREVLVPQSYLCEHAMLDGQSFSSDGSALSSESRSLEEAWFQ